MNAPSALIAFGVGLIGGGLYWRLMDDILAEYFQQFILNNEYYLASDLVWNALPYLLLIFGVLSLVVGALMSRGARMVSYE